LRDPLLGRSAGCHKKAVRGELLAPSPANPGQPTPPAPPGLLWRGFVAVFNLRCMRAPKKKPGEKLRPWRVSLMRARTQVLGVVYAPDEKSAEAAAIEQFKIGEDQHRRLVVRPDDE
jgi:hypothetical protein